MLQLSECSVMSEVISLSPGSRLPCTPVNFISPVLRRRGLMDGGGSSSRKSPVAKSVTTSSAMLEVNDDEAEKRERRRSKALEMQQQLLVSPVAQFARYQCAGFCGCAWCQHLSGMGGGHMTTHWTCLRKEDVCY